MSELFARPLVLALVHCHKQSTLLISTSPISNNGLSRSESLVSVLTRKSKNKYCGKEEQLSIRSSFSSFPQYFNISLTSSVRLHIYL